MKLFRPFLERIVLPVGDLLTRGSYVRELRKARSYMKLSEHQVMVLQKDKLQRLLEHASQNVPNYRSLGAERADDPYQWLQAFPVLEKPYIRENTDKLLSVGKNSLISISSSGSSGYQTTVLQSRRDRSVIRAVQTAFWEKEGFAIGSPVLQTGMNTSRTFEKKIKDFLFRTFYLSAYVFKPADVNRATAWVSRFRKGEVTLIGYASSLYVLAQIIEKTGSKVQFGSAIALGDKLFDHYRQKIESVFETRVYETYGASEGLMMGFQADLDYMYIPDFHVLLELVNDEGNPVKDGEMGHVLVTSLDNYAMPLIRYRVGDLAVKLPREKYPDKRDLPFTLLQRVIGRDTDIVRTPGGKKVIVHSFTGIFEHYPQIRQFCVIQEKIDGIVIEYIPSEDFTQDVLMEIEKVLQGHINEPFRMEFKEVEKIKSTGSGKPQLIISRL